MRIGVIGMGTVGVATARCWVEHAEVRTYDKETGRCTHSLDAALDCDMVFVCLPECAVMPWFHSLPVDARKRCFALRSTVPMGTTRFLREYGFTQLVHYPCFATERCANVDEHYPWRSVIGGEGACAKLLNAMLGARFPGVPVHALSSGDSELLKLGQNAFFAVKVAFFNELRALCDRAGGDWELLRKAMLSDGRISSSHTMVPGPDGELGFGGRCLPKDLSQFIAEQLTAGLSPHMASAAQRRNDADRKQDR